MNPKFKKIIIIAIVVLVLGIGGIIAYTTISNAGNTITITDFRILDENKEIMKDQYFHLGESESNEFKIRLSISSDGDDYGQFSIYSTNKSVANVYQESLGRYKVRYFSAGKASIILQCLNVPNLKASFNVTVYENHPIDLAFKDSNATDKKTIDVFADDLEHSYEFDLIGHDMEAPQHANLFEVVGTSNDDLFESATIDPATNSLKLKVNRYVDDQIVMSSNEYVVLQSYIKDSAGKKVVNGNHIVKINVNGNAIVDMQLAVSSDYEFSSEKTYIYSMLTDKDKVLSMLNPENEVFMDKVYLSQKNRVLYFKIRLVFANNEVMYVTDKCQFSGVSTGTTIEKNEEVDAILLGSKSKDMESFIVTLPAAYSPSREMVTRTFRFIILEENEKIDLSQLYTVHDGIYTYTYFDNRYKRMDSIVDREGNIVEFTGDKTGSIYTIRDDDDAGKKDGYVSSFTKTDTSVSPISGDE